MKKQMKNIRFVLAALLLCCVAMTSCQKDDIPEGAIRLFAEGFQSDDKTSVSDNAVYWEGGERVTINDQSLEVIVDNLNNSDTRIAYISYNVYGSFPSSIHGYYGIGGCGGYSGGSFTGIDFPRSYNSTYGSDGRQVIELPMVAYNANRSYSVRFRHISAAVLVKVKNEMSSDIVVDSVRVSSTNGQKLSGNGVGASFSGSLPVVSPNNVSGNNNYTSSKVEISGDNRTIATNEILDVQVPILPVSDCNLKVMVFCHSNNSAVEEFYTFEHTVEGITLGRNEMLTAGCRINTTTGRVAIGRVVHLDTLTRNYVAQDGDILTGTLQGNYEVRIAHGATITLRGAVVHGRGGNLGDYYRYSGLTCNGDATIILAEGDSNIFVSGRTTGAGIEVAAGHTLTIQGNGKLRAMGWGGAGIGGYTLGNCGNIVINCGSGSYIKVQSSSGAGIGCGDLADCGDITINCGTLECASGPIGIGSTPSQSCGNITITGGYYILNSTNMPIGAVMGTAFDDNGVLVSYLGTCGDINISNATIECTCQHNNMCCIGAGNGYSENSNDQHIGTQCGDITITNSTLTLTSGRYGAAIGTGYYGHCGNITINGGNFIFSGGADATKIGAGKMGICGDITISNVTLGSQQNPLQGGNNSAAIGTSHSATCGDITISGHGYVNHGSGATNTIGAGAAGTCGTVIINSTTYNSGYTGTSY